MAQQTKKINLSVLLNTSTDLSGITELKNKLTKVFADNNIGKSISSGLMKELDGLSDRAKEIFNAEIDPKNTKATLAATKSVTKFLEDYEKFIAKLNSTEIAEALVPSKAIAAKIKAIKKGLIVENENAKAPYREKYGQYRAPIEAEKQMILAETRIKELQKESMAAGGRLRNKKLTEEEIKAQKAIIDNNKILIAQEKNSDSLKNNREKVRLYKSIEESIKQNIAKTEISIAQEEEKLKLQKQLEVAGNISNPEFEEVKKAAAGVKEGLDDAGEAAGNYTSEAAKAAFKSSLLGQKLLEITSAAFLIRKAFQLVKSGINIVEKLDKTITGIAVVTNKSREEAWGYYDSLKALADRLSATTQEIADAALLYYQQGLSTAEVMEVVESTTIAAALAQIDFAEASDRMTAAIRGFDLEMSDAMEITDVFSSLAAYTAADFNEISYAMTKTASIAHTANMSLQNTTAFLAKMINGLF